MSEWPVDPEWDTDVPEVPSWLILELAAQPVDLWTDSDALDAAVGRPVGAGLLLDLQQVDPFALSADDAVTFAQQIDRLAAHVAGLQAKARAEVNARLIAHEAARPVSGSGSTFATPEMLASAELAPALRAHPRTMDALLQDATDLAGPLRPLRDALLEGRVSPGHASAVSRELHRLPSGADPALSEVFAQQCADLLAAVVPYAHTHTPGETARRARLLVAAIDPVGAREQRQRMEETEHGVWLTPTEHGSCQVTAVMPLAHGQAVMSAITTLARDPRFETAAGCVTAGQHRVAALVALMLGDPGSVGRITGPVPEAKITAHVSVVVPLDALTCGGDGADAGMLGGEPVDGDLIRDLVVEASPVSTLRRLVTDTSGCIVDAGRTRYAISDTQRHLVALRDRACRFPGCGRRAARCEIDHAVAWDDGGATDLDNLGALCKHHHQLKTHGGWRITRSERSGACTWRSPLGRIYHHDPPDLLPPKSVEEDVILGPPPF